MTQTKFMIPQIFEEFAENKHGIIVLATAFFGMLWSTASIWHKTYSNDILQILAVMLVGFGSAIVLHLFSKDTYWRYRMYAMYRREPKEFFLDFKNSSVILITALIIVGVITLIFACIVSFMNHVDAIAMELELIAVLIWIPVGIGILSWGVFSLDTIDDISNRRDYD